MSNEAPTTEDAPPPKFTPGGAYAFHAVGKDLVWDYVRGFFGLAVSAGVAGVSDAFSIAWWLMGTLSLAIGIYILHTVYRHGLRLEMDDHRLTAGWRNPLDPAGGIVMAKRHLAWDDLSELSLRHFTRKQQDQSGWTMLRLAAAQATPPVTITFDGGHEGFQPVLHKAWAMAQKKGLLLEEATLANLEALGFSTTSPAPWTS